MDEEILVRKIYEGKDIGKRKKERPKRTWNKEVKKPFEERCEKWKG